MLTIMKGLPEHVLGVRAEGTVDGDDLKKVLLPALEAQAERFGMINYLLVLETDVDHFTAGAWWQDFKAGLSNFSKWNRIAVVTPQKSVERFTDVFTYMAPGQSRGFAADQLQEAIDWVSDK
jgi:hypothetical protein